MLFSLTACGDGSESSSEQAGSGFSGIVGKWIEVNVYPAVLSVNEDDTYNEESSSMICKKGGYCTEVTCSGIGKEKTKTVYKDGSGSPEAHAPIRAPMSSSESGITAHCTQRHCGCGTGISSGLKLPSPSPSSCSAYSPLLIACSFSFGFHSIKAITSS